MSSKEWRLAVAVVIGVLFDAVFYWRFQPYSSRNAGHDDVPGLALPAFAFLAGLLLTLGMEGRKRLVPLALVGGFFAANACLIVADCWNDPTNHNLWPFEFVIIVVMTAPAWLGAGISTLIERMRKA
jgi:peptidoglycan/LPS O-acetylase OafA/YrhL